MKIVNNDNDRGFRKFIHDHKKETAAVAGVIAAIVVVILLVVFFRGGYGAIFGKSGKVSYENGSESAAMESKDGTAADQTEAANNESFPNEEGYIGDAGSKITSNVAPAVQYTGIRTDEESLIALVKETVTGYSDILKKSETDEFEGANLVSTLAILENASATGIDLNGTFVSTDGSPSPVDQIAEVSDSATATTLSYLDVAGSIGTDLFYNTTNYVPGYYRPGEVLCRMFIADGVYKLPINDANDWSVASDTSGTFLTSEVTGTRMEINFVVKFTCNNQQYQALIGNISDGYIVLDIAKVNQNVPTTQSKSNTGVVETQAETQARKSETSARRVETSPAAVAPETTAAPAPETSTAAPETAAPETRAAAPETAAKNDEDSNYGAYEDENGYYLPGYGYIPNGEGGVIVGESDHADNPGRQIGH